MNLHHPFPGIHGFCLIFIAISCALLSACTDQQTKLKPESAHPSTPQQIPESTTAPVNELGTTHVTKSMLTSGYPAYIPNASISDDEFKLVSNHNKLIFYLALGDMLKYYPEISPNIFGDGTDPDLSYLRRGWTDLEASPQPPSGKQHKLFIEKYGYPPTSIKYAMSPMAVYVHKDNPLVARGLSLEELDAIFSLQKRRGHSTGISKWSELDREWELKNRRINLYRPNRHFGLTDTFKQGVMKGGPFRDPIGNYHQLNDLSDIIKDDPDAIAFGPYHTHVNFIHMKPVPIRDPHSGKLMSPSMTNLYKGYPLIIYHYFHLNHHPDQPMAASTREFIRFMYSKNASDAINKAGYAPLPWAQAKIERDKALRTITPESKYRTESLKLDPRWPDYIHTDQKFTDMLEMDTSTDTIIWAFTKLQINLRKLKPSLTPFLNNQGRGPLAIYTGSEDLIFMESRWTDQDISRFKQRHGYPPTQINFAQAVYAVILHPDNPLLEQGIDKYDLQAAILHQPKYKTYHPRTTWGEMGLKGDWENAPIQLYGRENKRHLKVLQNKVYGNNGKIRELTQAFNTTDQVIEAVSQNPHAMAIVPLLDATDERVRMLHVAPWVSWKPLDPRKAENLREYPLKSQLFISFNLNPKTKAMKPELRTFLNYLFSQQGQQCLLNGRLVPVSYHHAQRQLEQLNILLRPNTTPTNTTTQEP